jgi:hypothetical protein
VSRLNERVLGVGLTGSGWMVAAVPVRIGHMPPWSLPEAF